MINIVHKYKLILGELFRYGVTGAVTTIVNMVIYVGLTKLGLYYLIANLIAWISAVLLAFLTNKYFVFKNQGSGRKSFIIELISFISCRTLTGFIDMLIMFVGVSLLNKNDIILKITSDIIVIALNYILSKVFIFNNYKADIHKE